MVDSRYPGLSSPFKEGPVKPMIPPTVAPMPQVGPTGRTIDSANALGDYPAGTITVEPLRLVPGGMVVGRVILPPPPPVKLTEEFEHGEAHYCPACGALHTIKTT